MPRQALPSKALALMLVVFVAIFATQASAKYIKAQLSEFELMLPLACPDTCGIWCDKCPMRDLGVKPIGIDEDGNIILDPDNQKGVNGTEDPTHIDTSPDDDDSDSDPLASSSTSKPQTGGPLELGDTDSVVSPAPPVPLIGADGQLLPQEEGTGGGDDESTPIISPGMMDSTFKIKRSALSRRQSNDDIIKDDVSRPETWGAGSQEWWSKMNGIIEDRGLILDWTPRSSALVEYFDTDELDAPQTLPDANRAGGVPALRGSTLFVAVSNLGIYTGHFWESPTFVAIKNDTSQSQENQGLIWHPERQARSWLEDVQIFTYVGTFDWHNATKISEKYRYVGNNPPLKDLVRPGMILDKKSTQWREFRLFQPRDSHRGPPGTAAKNEEKMNEFRAWLADLLHLKEEEIVRHAPFYEPNGPTSQLGPHKPTDYHNTFTWQYGSPVSKSSTRPDADREFHATFNGETIAELSRTWRSGRVLNDDKCRLHVTVSAVQTSDVELRQMDLQVSVIQPGGKLIYESENWKYPVQYATDSEDNQYHVIKLAKDATGLKEEVSFGFTRGAKEVVRVNGQKPNYDDWHIEFQYGEGEDQTFKFEDMDTDATVQCRGGAWKLTAPWAGFTRDSVCQFKCEIEAPMMPSETMTRMP